MPSKRKEPDIMMDFILNRLSSEDLETASLIQALPATVRPSQQVVDKMRAQLLELTSASESEPRAA